MSLSLSFLIFEIEDNNFYIVVINNEIMNQLWIIVPIL